MQHYKTSGKNVTDRQNTLAIKDAQRNTVDLSIGSLLNGVQNIDDELWSENGPSHNGLSMHDAGHLRIAPGFYR